MANDFFLYPYYKAIVTFLKEVERIDKVKQESSLICDGSIYNRSRSITNFMVNTIGTVFLE